jgi:hypothetical protein
MRTRTEGAPSRAMMLASPRPESAGSRFLPISHQRVLHALIDATKSMGANLVPMMTVANQWQYNGLFRVLYQGRQYVMGVHNSNDRRSVMSIYFGSMTTSDDDTALFIPFRLPVGRKRTGVFDVDARVLNAVKTFLSPDSPQAEVLRKLTTDVTTSWHDKLLDWPQSLKLCDTLRRNGIVPTTTAMKMLHWMSDLLVRDASSCSMLALARCFTRLTSGRAPIQYLNRQYNFATTLIQHGVLRK